MSRHWLSLIGLSPIIVGGFFIPQNARSDDFEGASALIQKLTAASQAPAASPSSAQDDSLRQLKPDVRDNAVFNVLRLDSGGRHITPSTEYVRQLAKLWDVEAECVKVIPPAPKTLLSLTASAAEQTAREAARKKSIPPGLDDDDLEELYEQQIQFRFGHQQKDESNPRQAVLANGVISTAIQMFR